MSPRRVPKLRKCRSCWRNFDPRVLVTERLRHDERGYPLPVCRWCPPCAASRLTLLRAERDPRNDEAIADLEEAMDRLDRAMKQAQAEAARS